MTTTRVGKRRPERSTEPQIGHHTATRGGTKVAVGLATGLAAGMLIWAATATVTASASAPAKNPPSTSMTLQKDYADLVEQVSPAVVFISSTQHNKPTLKMKGEGSEQSPFPPGSPFNEMFRKFFEQSPQMHQQHRPVTALGSGFIIDTQGDIVTNNHVVEGASEIKVKLPDGREFNAKVVGTDPRTDLALLKVKAKKPLPFVSFGDSAKLRPGNPVLAVGNPFGLGGTVTSGIVSARNRNINAGPYDDFIQTDAAINHGNSGGPLFNTAGKVVGVNTAIFSPNGGSVGIGFAIPSNIVSNVVAQLKDHGKVERGWLGVKIQQVTPDIAKAVGMEKPKGALVAEVTADSPAAKAGIRQGDIIVDYGNHAIDKMQALPLAVASTRAGTEATMKLWRDGAIRTVEVKIGKLKPEQMASAGSEGNSQQMNSPELAAELAALDPDTRAKLGLSDDTSGVVIVAVDPDGTAAEHGLRRGDVIEKVGNNAVTQPTQVEKALRQSKEEKKAALLLINRKGSEMFVGLRVSGA